MILPQSKVFPNLVGTVRNVPVFSDTGTLLPNPSALVETPRGVRKVLPEEWGKLQGMPKHWADPTGRYLGILLREPSLHVLSTIGEIVHQCFGQAAELHSLSPPITSPPVSFYDDTSPWEYELLDISETSVFHVERLEALCQASSHYPNPEDIVAEGHE
jgi:hypothetical protein